MKIIAVSTGLGTAAVCVALVVAWPAAASAAAAASGSPTPAASPTDLPPAHVDLSVQSDRPHILGSSVTLTATLGPADAFGQVTLYDGSVKVASGSQYRLRWTYSTQVLGVGPHHFSVYFTPTAASGYAPAVATLDYSVKGTQPGLTCPSSPVTVPSGTPTVQPTITPTSSRSSRPTSSSTPTRPVAPTASATGTRRPGHHHQHPGTRASASTRPTVGATGSSAGSGGGGALPFTGLDAVGLVVAAALLIFQGTALVSVTRRRRIGGTGGSHLL